MRENLPVTNREYDFPADATLMSTTDTQSRITYANDAFVAVSGFTRDEIDGQPHNLVRHPDMPREAFADMWATLQAGEPWTALVKNRRKNGDHYWVRANATPVIRDGRISGYMSVRTKPARDEIDAAEALYASFREGRAGHLRFNKGLITRTGPMGWMSGLQSMSAQWRIRCALSAATAASVASAWALGFGGYPLLAFAGCLGVIMLLASLWLRQQISKPLEAMRDQALRIATGDVKAALHMNRTDEIGMTLRTIGQLGLMFRWIIDDVSGQVMNAKTATAEDRPGQHRPERTHRAGCGQRRADGVVDGRNDGDGQEQRKHRSTGHGTFRHREFGRRERGPGGRRCRHDDERDHAQLEGRSPTSSASSIRSRSRPTSWR